MDFRDKLVELIEEEITAIRMETVHSRYETDEQFLKTQEKLGKRANLVIELNKVLETKQF